MKKPIQIESITAVRAIDIKSLLCSSCNWPATLNADGICMHCEKCPRGRVSGPTIWERVRAWLHRSGDAEPLTTIK